MSGRGGWLEKEEGGTKPRAASDSLWALGDCISPSGIDFVICEVGQQHVLKMESAIFKAPTVIAWSYLLWGDIFISDNEDNYYNDYLFLIFCLFSLFRAASAAYGGSQARGSTRAVATSLRQSHSNAGSKPHLRPTPPDPN